MVEVNSSPRPNEVDKVDRIDRITPNADTAQLSAHEMRQDLLPFEGLPAGAPRTVMSHPESRIARFMKKVVKTSECWYFVGAIGDDGYGRFSHVDDAGRARVVSAHRFAWEASRTDSGLLGRNLVLMHECNNTICVRIGRGHVVAGTQAQNIRYADSLGRRQGRRPVHGFAIAAQARMLRAQLRGDPIDDAARAESAYTPITLF